VTVLKRFAITAVLLTTFIPSASAYYFPTDGSYVAPDGTAVELRRSFTLRDRLDLSRAMEIYREYVRQGLDGLIKPTIDNRESIDVYLHHAFPSRQEQTKSDPVSTDDYIKKETDVVTGQSISRQQRVLLRQSERLGKCWRGTLLTTQMYALCQQFIDGKDAQRSVGLESDTAPKRRVQK
jgi:hypothetical protein